MILGYKVGSNLDERIKTATIWTDYKAAQAFAKAVYSAAINRDKLYVSVVSVKDTAFVHAISCDCVIATEYTTHHSLPIEEFMEGGCSNESQVSRPATRSSLR